MKGDHGTRRSARSIIPELQINLILAGLRCRACQEVQLPSVGTSIHRDNCIALQTPRSGGGCRPERKTPVRSCLAPDVQVKLRSGRVECDRARKGKVSGSSNWTKDGCASCIIHNFSVERAAPADSWRNERTIVLEIKVEDRILNRSEERLDTHFI